MFVFILWKKPGFILSSSFNVSIDSKLLPWIYSYSRKNDYYSEAMERNIHLEGKGAAHGNVSSVVPKSNAGGVSKNSSRASMVDGKIDGRACSTVV